MSMAGGGLESNRKSLSHHRGISRLITGNMEESNF